MNQFNWIHFSYLVLSYWIQQPKGQLQIQNRDIRGIEIIYQQLTKTPNL
jgi:hypothetical protein